MHHESPELERAIAHFRAGYHSLPIDLVQTLQEQGFDPESIRDHFQGGQR